MPPRFELPGPRRVVDWRAVLAAAALHAVVLLLVVLAPIMTYEETVRYVFIGEAPGDTEEIDWPSYSLADAPGTGAPGPRRTGAPRGGAERAAPQPTAGLEPGGPIDSIAGVVAAVGGGGAAENDSAPATPSPRLGSGSLWVRPLRLADLPDDARESILADPRISARLQAIFDSIRSEPGAEQALPAWAVDIPGVGRAGIDSGWIMLGPIRIPAAVLALIPLPVQGNYEEAERAERLAEMRADLIRAAQRAATVEEFKLAVKELRERKDRERDAERARRGRDTIIP